MSADRSLGGIMHRVANAVRRDAFIAVIAAAFALAPVVLLLGWVVGGWRRPSLVPLFLDLLLVFVGVLVVLRARRRIHAALDEGAIARAAEERMELPAGALRGALELGRSLPAGASAALAERSERALALRLDTASPGDLSGDLGSAWRRKRTTALATFGILLFAVMFAGFATPVRSRAAWTSLLHPVRNLTPPKLDPLDVHPGNASVTRGGELAVRVRAPAREAVTVHWQVQGDIVRTQLLRVLHDSASCDLTHLDGVTEYWVDAPDGAVSPHYRITPLDPLLLSELSVDVMFPSYVNRANEHYDGDLPALEIPQGTELLLHGRATRALKQASLVPDSGTAVPMHVDANGFTMRWVPRASGLYAWDMRDAANNPLAVEPAPIALSIIRDAAPTVSITFPGVDTVFGAELQLAVEAEAQDDHAVASAALVTWRVSRTGARDAAVETALPIVASADRVIVQSVLDASARNLTAGDTLKYFVRVRDNSPYGQSADSRTYAIRLPGMNEMRDAARDQAANMMKANDEIARAAAKLQEDTRNTERRTSASNAARANGGQSTPPSSSSSQGERMQFGESQAAQKVLEQQQQLLSNMDSMRAKVEALQKSLENAGLQDADLQKRMEELRKLYDQALTPELKARMDQLKQAIDKLDPQQVDNALKDLAKEQEALKDQIERSMQLMQRAAAEQQMNKLTQEAKELSRQEDAHASALPEEKDAKASAAQQQDLARKNDALAKEMNDLKDQLSKQGEARAASAASKAADTANAARQSMQNASQHEQGGKTSDAQRDATKASQQLNDAAQQLDQARQEMVKSWKDETQESMQQATRDALSLAQRQQALKDQMEKAGTQPSGMQPPSLPKPPQPQAQVGKQDEKKNGAQPIPSSGQGAQPQQGKQDQQGRSGGAGEKQQGTQSGGREGGAGQSGTPQPGAAQPGAAQPAPGQSTPQPDDLQAMRSEQSALQQGLQQLGKNLQETGDRSAQVNREVGSSLSRANQSMQQTQDALQSASPNSQLPSDQASQTVDALNKLALSLLKNSQEVQQSKDGTGMQQALEKMSELAKQQGSLNGQGSSLVPMNLAPGAMSEQVRKLGQAQQQIAQDLNDVNKTAAKDATLGSVDELAKEAAAIAQQMQSGRLEPQTIARQEKLFHRLLDAGRSLQKDEVSNERVAERPVNTTVTQPAALDPKLFQDGTRFRAPTPEELRALPPAYRKIILDYFERLNHTTPDKSK